LNYRRISTLICYIFYKNSLICFTSLWFGLSSGFSGQPLFLEWAYQLYNVCFTAIPILIFAIMDRDLSHRTLAEHPKIYKETSHGQLFNFSVFARWLILSMFQSVIVYFVPFMSMQVTTPDSSGQGFDFWAMGLIVYTAVVIVVNLKIALVMTSWTWLHHVSVWGSIAFFYFCMIVFSLSPVWATAGCDYYWLQFRLFETPRYWFILVITVVAALLVDFTARVWRGLPVVPRNALAEPDPFKNFSSDPRPTSPGGYVPPVHPAPHSENIDSKFQTPSAPLRKSSREPSDYGSNSTYQNEERRPSRQLTGFDFSHTSGQGQQLGFRY